MMSRVTLREVRKALAAARVKGAKALATAPTVEELESLARVLEQQAAAKSTVPSAARAPGEEPRGKGVAEQGAATARGGHRSSRRSARARGRRR